MVNIENTLGKKIQITNSEIYSNLKNKTTTLDDFKQAAAKTEKGYMEEELKKLISNEEIIGEGVKKI